MASDMFYAGGMLVGIILVVWAVTRKSGKARHYDEMQQKIRADGYRLGFFVTLVLLTVTMFALEMGLDRTVAPSLAVYAAMMLGLTVFAVYCIRHEAFISIGCQGKQFLITYALVTALNAIVAVRKLQEGTAVVDGRLTLSFGAPALLSLCFLVVLITLGVKMAHSGKEVSE